MLEDNEYDSCNDNGGITLEMISIASVVWTTMLII